MARRAPAVERAVAVLNHLAAHPGRKISLSEIARDVGLNKATLHAILAALTESGFLVRDETAKTYGLGPALVAVGNAALVGQPAVDVARPEMQALTEELGLDCVASAAIHDEIVILERTGTPRPFGVNVMPGQRLPLRPPLGTVFVAWSAHHAIDRYLAKLGEAPKAALDRSRRSIETVRARGFSVGLEQATLPKPKTRKPRVEPPSLAEGVRTVRMEEYSLSEIEARATYRINHIGAPVFGAGGDVVLAVFLIGFTAAVTGEQVTDFAERLATATARITKAVHGKAP